MRGPEGGRKDSLDKMRGGAGGGQLSWLQLGNAAGGVARRPPAGEIEGGALLPLGRSRLLLIPEVLR